MEIEVYIYELLYVEYGYVKLACDIEETLGWDYGDFDSAFFHFKDKFQSEKHPLKKFFVIEEYLEFDLMINLESAFKSITFQELSKQIIKGE